MKCSKILAIYALPHTRFSNTMCFSSKKWNKEQSFLWWKSIYAWRWISYKDRKKLTIQGLADSSFTHLASSQIGFYDCTWRHVQEWTSLVAVSTSYFAQSLIPHHCTVHSSEKVIWRGTVTSSEVCDVFLNWYQNIPVGTSAGLGCKSQNSVENINKSFKKHGCGKVCLRCMCRTAKWTKMTCKWSFIAKICWKDTLFTKDQKITANNVFFYIWQSA